MTPALTLVAGAIAHPDQVYDLLDAAPVGTIQDQLLGAVWGVIGELAQAGRTPDLATVQAELLARGLTERIAPEALADLALAPPLAKVRAAAQAVQAQHRRARYLALAQGVVQDLEATPADASAAIWAAFLDEGLRAASSRGMRRTDLAEGMAQSLKRAEQRAAGEAPERSWSLGVDGLEETWSLAPAELLILGAGSGQGKTALAQWLGLRLVQSTGRGVLYLPLADVDGAALADRALAHTSRRSSREVSREIPHDAALRDMRAAVVKSAPWLAGRFTVVDGTSSDVEDLEQLVRQERLRMLAQGVQLGLVVMDYAQTITTRDRRLTDMETLRVVSSRLKALAKDLDLTVALPSQYNRDLDRRGPGAVPTAADLFGGSAMLHYADAVALLQRTSIRHVPPIEESDWRQRLRRYLVHLVKNRGGPEAKIPLIADLATYSYWPEKRCPHYDPPPPPKAKKGGDDDVQDLFGGADAG